MRFISTRGRAEPVSFNEAVENGLAPDGGLYLPEVLPDLSAKLDAWSGLDYPDLCLEFFRCFADDMEPASLEHAIRGAYMDFPGEEVAPVRQIGEKQFVLELFHGPTLAFKDFALQVLGNLYAEQIRRKGEALHVLGATSGDTGAAAISGLRGKRGVHTFILYPAGRVSPLQERQMTCTGDPRVFPLAIQGSFDDAQAALKALFGDQDFRVRNRLSAVNSINLARILAQSVYYLWAWFRLPGAVRRDTEVVVPTGNFGNVLSGWLLTLMGVPWPRFRVATNQNDILYRLFHSGVYQRGEVAPSLAPSMDIQVASNFERFLFYLLDRDPDRVRDLMGAFAATGKVELPGAKEGAFAASRTQDSRILELIRETYSKFNYICDPHTACAFQDLADARPSLVLATAHPAKFPETIERAIGRHPRHDTLEALKEREPHGYRVEPTAEAIAEFIESHPASL